VIKKINIFLFRIIIVIVFPFTTYSQPSDSLKYSKLYPFIVDSIKISGNDITEEDIILRELNFGIGDTLTNSSAFYNRERIYSLGIFNHVYLIPETINQINIINIKVEESWYIYPLLFIDASENDLKKLTYGINLRLKNFRGRNEQLSAIFALGYDPYFYISYYTPNVENEHNIFLNIKVGYADISNKSPVAEMLYGSSFEHQIIFFETILGKRIGLFQRVYFNSAFSNIETPKYVAGISASNDRIDNVLDFGVGYEYDTRDLIQFPKDGIFAAANITFRGFGIDEINYRILRVDFREYRILIDKLVSKWKLAGRMTFGNKIPYYDNSIIGVDQKIRGHISQKYEGDDIYIGSLEFTYPVIEELNIDLSFIPIIPNKLLSYRFGLYLQSFAETGIAKYKKQPFALNRFVSGYGFGITFLVLPYQVFRFELGFDEKSNSEIILDLGISF
jgi:outer membrane protein assembly factor BamA